jgi:SAM-dependent methyltransferase
VPATPDQSTLPNYFASAEVAARYAGVRPFFHEEVARRICRLSGVERFTRALDVGCGAGHSSIALAAIAGQVVGIDISPEMLAQATTAMNVRYQQGAAEQLEFEDGGFDLVSVGLALHWFDQPRFFSECRRVMSESGVLAIYNDHFTAHMAGNVACKRWMRTRFAKRFPQPKRGLRDIDEDRAAQCGFVLTHRAPFSHEVRFTRVEFIAYLLTRSNTLAAIHSGRESAESASAWLNGELAGIVPDGTTGEFIFKCNLWLMRKDTRKEAAEATLIPG